MSRSAWQRLRPLAMALFVLVTSGVVVAGSAVPAQAAETGCQNGGYRIIYARGATAPLESYAAKELRRHLRYLLPSAAWDELGNLDRSVAVDDGVEDGEEGPDGDDEYPAAAIGGWWYGDSVEKGTRELINHLNRRYAPTSSGGMGCNKETAIIAGYSEGADAVGWAMGWEGYGGLSQAAKDHIGYVALYGDPKFDRRCQSARWWVRGHHKDCGGNGILGTRDPDPYARDYLSSRLGSWCDGDDGYCNGTLLQGTHSSAYTGYWFQQSAHVVVGRAVLKRNSLNPESAAHQTPANWTPEEDSPPEPALPVVKSVKRRTDHVGTYQLYAATKSAVTEVWWRPNEEVHAKEMIHISQDNIVGFDKVNEPDGTTQSLYTAVPDGVWETWWRPGDGPHHNKIITGLSGVRQVIADPVWDGGQYTHRLYVLAEDGPYEVWWREGGDGIHVNRLDIVSDPVTMTKSRGPDGTDQLYVATPTWVYELWWRPDTAVNHGEVINITQGDIRSLDKGANLPDGGQLLYTGTSTTAWQTYWNNSAPSHGTITVGQSNAGQIKKTVYDGVHQLYQTNGCRVQENWWNGPSSGSSTLINISQCNITSFDKSADGPDQQVYTASGDLVYETWWRGGSNPSGPNTGVLFKVAR